MILRRIEATAAGLRLDKYLASRFGEMGLRGWRRAIESGAALINGRKTSPGLRLQGFEELRILMDDMRPSAQKAAFLGSQGDYLFFYKPAGLHSAAIAGNSNDSLERQLPSLCARHGLSAQITLLQRLDFGTAGIICAASSAEAVNNYRSFERQGKCKKSYLALLAGILAKPVIAKNALAVNGGKKVRIKYAATEDPRLWTTFEPLWNGQLPDNQNQATIAKCGLCAGQRHQVRAHAAAVGLPLLGDDLYGSPEGSGFSLEHYRIEFPGCAFQYLSPQSPFAAFSCALGANGDLQCM